MKTKNNQYHVPRNHVEIAYGLEHHQPNVAASFKRRKYSESHQANSGRNDYNSSSYICALPSCNNLLPASSEPSTSPLASGKRVRLQLPDGDDAELISRDEIDRRSSSRKDGIDALHETHLRYSYCAFIQNLGMLLELPQTTTGTAMVLCHHFFLWRSHSSYDRYSVIECAIFVTTKSQILDQGPVKRNFKNSHEVILHWHCSQHQFRSSLWLQFKPQHIAAGAAYLAAKLLNMDLDCCRSISWEFQTPPAILHDVVQQLMEPMVALMLKQRKVLRTQLSPGMQQFSESMVQRNCPIRLEENITDNRVIGLAFTR
ncbi:Cyclin-T1-5-like protein [Drosera capensis]